MEVIKINKEDLEYIRKMSEDFIKEFRYPLYIEFDKNSSIVIVISYGKYIDYFTHVDVIFPENIIIQNLKMLVKFNRSDINAENIKNANISSSIDIENIIIPIFKGDYLKIEESIKMLQADKRNPAENNDYFGTSEYIDTAINALEKQMPKKVIKISGVSSQACPVCKHNVNGNYCSNCGQKIML